MNLFIIKKIRNKEYKVFLPLMWFTVIFLLTISLAGLIQNDWSLEPSYYIYCDSVRGCQNDYFESPSCMNSVLKDEPLCTQKLLRYGESLGSPPPFFVKYINELSWGILIIFIVLNTVLFNKGFFKDFKVEQ